MGRKGFCAGTVFRGLTVRVYRGVTYCLPGNDSGAHFFCWIFAFAEQPTRAIILAGMISIATKRITTTTSKSMTSTMGKSTMGASGEWRNI